MKIIRTSAFSALATAALFSSYAPSALTQSEAEPAIEEVVVRAHPLSAEGLAQPSAVLNSDQLQRVVASSLGETLVGLPSVHSSSFGQAVGRPIIRGLGGPRVKTMEDRIDSLDVSVSSPDHLTTVEPFAANSIEVLKGPSTLLYGTGAIGGVVDVHTGRIPHEVPDKVSVQVDARGADNAERRSTAAKLDAGIGGFAIHLDGFYREADDYEIPGFAESRGLRALEEAEHEGEEEHEEEEEHGHEEEEAFGELPGSDLKSHGGAFGLSYVGERGFIGLAVSSYEAEYGLPGHGHHEEEGHDEEEAEEEHEEEEEEGNPNLDLEQTRIDFEAGLSEPFAGIESINLRIGANDYEHIEVEGNGEPGTTFSTEAYEARIELVHEEALGIKGSFGVQVSQREFEADGEEAFVRPVDTDNYGVFY
ncbi:MAG: Plug domain-containing protein, partial [Pseudomonadota bacterium]